MNLLFKISINTKLKEGYLMRKLFFVQFIAIFFTMALSATSTELFSLDENNDGKPDRWIEKIDDKIRVVKTDKDYDGIIDQIVWYTEAGEMEKEGLDYNKDGKMDDFYLYERGVLSMREIDSNYDDKIDVWVYMDEGVYINKFERDTDFDGKVDIVKDYNKN